ncbi:MAG: bifunctional metallophosphatase/5'-nucleotidase [Bacteroidia bacterium]|nr:bifunctional metallophosphatase/5'-nucleotidase [Bacteroidia bacterium]
MKRHILIAASIVLMVQGCCRPLNGDYEFHILTTNDIHGTYFDASYTDGSVKPSLMAVNHYVDSIRKAEGKKNVVLIDAGDFLQGDNAAYYFNYVDSTAGHIYPRIAKYMGYDAIVAGNHDIETGHPVYDRIAGTLEDMGIPFLAGNAIRNDDGERYFPTYTILKRNGIKIAVLGYDNANIKAWLNESLWSGMHFESLLPLVQEDVDTVIEKEAPHIVLVAVHSGTGAGDGNIFEDQALDLYNSLEGVDAVICGHDHQAFVTGNGNRCLINTGSHSRNLGHGVISLTVEKGKVVSKSADASLIPIDASKADARMRTAFKKDFDTVQEFTLKEVGELKADLRLQDALTGMSDYINLIHTVCLRCEPAQLSIVAPLSIQGTIKAGTLVYNDLFNLYKYENQLFIVQLKGEEIKNYLETSYENWINTVQKPGDHVLNIKPSVDENTGKEKWIFAGPTYNLDSMAGLNYTVDVTEPAGSRVAITTLANGEPFLLEATYNVAMTSYRASGGGGLLPKIGVDTDNIEERVVSKYPEIRELLYDYIQETGDLDPEVVGDPEVIGHWEFIPENIAGPGIEADMQLYSPVPGR